MVLLRIVIIEAVPRHIPGTPDGLTLRMRSGQRRLLYKGTLNWEGRVDIGRRLRKYTFRELHLSMESRLRLLTYAIKTEMRELNVSHMNIRVCFCFIKTLIICVEYSPFFIYFSVWIAAWWYDVIAAWVHFERETGWCFLGFCLIHNHAKDFFKSTALLVYSLYVGVHARPINTLSSLFVLGEIWTRVGIALHGEGKQLAYSLYVVLCV